MTGYVLLRVLEGEDQGQVGGGSRVPRPGVQGASIGGHRDVTWPVHSVGSGHLVPMFRKVF